ncbi:MAG: T9SS type B sorting domain-containing protein [Bacteroidetes bacterium]|nr:T9SS type B sorting domain-containing protein [Bacteroidota bacterium]
MYTNPERNAFFGATGVSVDGNDNVYVNSYDLGGSIITKLGADGAVEWAQRVYTSNQQYNSDDSGSVLSMCGLQNGDLTFTVNEWNIAMDTLEVARTNSEGELIWSKAFPEVRHLRAGTDPLLLNPYTSVHEVGDEIIVVDIPADGNGNNGLAIMHLSEDGNLSDGSIYQTQDALPYFRIATSRYEDTLLVFAIQLEGPQYLFEYNLEQREMVQVFEVNCNDCRLKIAQGEAGQRFMLVSNSTGTRLAKYNSDLELEWCRSYDNAFELAANGEELFLSGIDTFGTYVINVAPSDGSLNWGKLYIGDSAFITDLAGLSTGGVVVSKLDESNDTDTRIILTDSVGEVAMCAPTPICSIEAPEANAPTFTAVSFSRSPISEQIDYEVNLETVNLEIEDSCTSSYDPDSIVFSPYPLCVGDTATASHSTNTLPVDDDAWTAPGGSLIPLQTDSIQLVYGQAGTYEVQYEWSLFGCRDTASAEVAIGEAPVFSLPADSALCPGDSLLLSTALDPDSYELEWQDGSTQAERWATAPGLYHLTATSLSTRCRSTDSTALTALPIPLVDLGEDIVECAAEWTIGNTLDPSWDYIWNTGATLPETTVAQSGTYRLSVTNNEGCTSSDSLEVSLLDRPQFRYSSDTSFCPGRPILLNARSASKDSLTFLWPDGSSGNTFRPDQPGTYSLIAANAACKDTVAIVVEAGDCQSEVFVPTAFSPNDDGRNDFFQAFGPGIEPLRLQIYHRWGGLLYEGMGANARWDGRANGKTVNAGHYAYVLEYRDRLSLEVRQISGTVAVVR